jgi:outer membrane protein assembly factor BamB
LWAVDCGEGYAGAAVREGRVYLMDYDAGNKQNALRCLSLADGGEIWRYAYPLPIKRNHGITRTMPVVTDKYVVAMDPKCHVFCVDAASGQLRWGVNLVSEYGATVPQWYAGQCPLIEAGAVILAPGGPAALLAAVDIETGKTLWRSPNPRGWKMTHSSVTAMEFGGRRIYVYCASGGVAGISAKDGALLWDTDVWKISFATVPSPLVVGEGKIFLSGGYGAGSMLLQLEEQGGRLAANIVWKLAPAVFGATQQTPLFHDGHIFGTRPNGQFVCLDLDGKALWASPPVDGFGRAPFLLADGLFFVMNEDGRLSLMEDSPEHFKLLAQAQVLKGGEAWGPMALAGGRLLARDLTRLVCLDVAAPPQPK